MRRFKNSQSLAVVRSAENARNLGSASEGRIPFTQGVSASWLLGLALLLSTIGSATPASSTPRVLLVGDSWAGFMWSNRTLRDVFAANGRSDLFEEGATTAIGGTTAGEWALPEMLTVIADALDAAPTIDTVQLTVGGNDFLAGLFGGGWHTGISAMELDLLTTDVLNSVSTILDHVLALRADVEVVVSLYDYPRFFGLSPLGAACDSTWDDLGQPTPLEVNLALLALEDALLELVGSQPRAFAVSHRGLMQATFGLPEDGIDPGELSPPGDPERPSPSAGMFLGLDCIHLSSDGYLAVGQRLWDLYYRQRFEPGVFADGFESGDVSNWQ